MSSFRREPAWPLAALLVIAAALLLVASASRTFGHTWDEPEHLASGLERVDLGRYDFDIQHPPIARAMIALGPYFAGARSKPPPEDIAVGRMPGSSSEDWLYTAVAEDWHVGEARAAALGLNGVSEGMRVLYTAPDYDRVLALARLGVLPFFALLLVATWRWARRVSSPAGATLAVACTAATPALLGHAGIAALDVPAAATVALALYALHSWLAEPTWRRVMVLGACAGLAVGTKLSALPFLAVGAGVVGVIEMRCGFVPPVPARARPGLRGPGSLAGIAVAVAIALAMLTIAYGPRLVYLTDAAHRTNALLDTWFGTSGTLRDAAYAFAAHVPVPAIVPLLGGGIDALFAHNGAQNTVYLLGETNTVGWWYFYPVALAAKTPLPMLAFGLAGLGMLAREGWRTRDRWRLAIPVTFGALLAFCCAFVRINIGVRHVLVVYPFLAVGMAHALSCLWRLAGASRVRGTAAAPGTAMARAMYRAVAVVALAWHLTPAALAKPDYLPWFNEAVRDPRDVLVDSDLDWGQDLKRLSRRLHELDVPSVRLAYAGTADLSKERLPPYERLAPNERATGWIAVTELARLQSRRGGAPDGYRWLDTYGVRERVGRTIDLYFIPPSAEPGSR